MRAVPGFLLILVLLAAIALVVGEWGDGADPEGIYANAVFLTVDEPMCLLTPPSCSAG
jgi:hypothetical protein